MPDNDIEVVIDDGSQQQSSAQPPAKTETATNGAATAREAPQRRDRPQQQQHVPSGDRSRRIEGDAESYGRRMQLKINQYRRRVGDAEAIAARYQNENARLVAMLSATNVQAVDAYLSAAKAREVSAQRALKAAHDSADGQQIVEATRELAAATSALENATAAHNQMAPQRQALQHAQSGGSVQPQAAPAAPQERGRPRYSQATEDWIARNPWFEDDDDARETALKIHNKLVDNGFTPDTPDYFGELDKRMAVAMPEVVGGQAAPARLEPETETEVEVETKPRQQEREEEQEAESDPFNAPSTAPLSTREMRPVVNDKGRKQERDQIDGRAGPRYETTPVRRGTPNTDRRPGVVRLSPAQVEAARISGVKIEDYARSLARRDSQK